MSDGGFFGDFGLDTSAFEGMPQQVDTGAFGNVAGGFGDYGQPDWMSQWTPPSPGNQDWMNSLGTGAGTYGTGLDYDPVSGGTFTSMTPQQQQAQIAQLGRPPAATPTGWQGALSAGASGLGALGNILGLGVSGLGMANAVRAMQQGGEQRKQLQQAQQQAQQVAAPAAQAGANLTRAGEQAMLGGALPEHLEGLVEKRKNELRGKLNDYFARAGISDSTMINQYETWINQQADLQRQAYAESLYKGGLSGIDTAMRPIGQSGNWAQGQMGGTDKFLQEANRSIALLTGAQRAPGT